MDPVTKISGPISVLRRSDVDTDQIIPKQFLKRIERSGFGQYLFFDWRSAGCSMCLGMNPDILTPGERCASTSNRNFEGRQGKGGRTHLVSPKMAAAAAIEGRQGKGGRTHLVSPPMAAAAAIAGHLVDVRAFDPGAVEAEVH